MVFSYYLTKPVYAFFWHLAQFFRRERLLILYCEDAFDAVLFRNVQKHLPQQVTVYAKNLTVQNDLKNLGYKSRKMPVFPDAVIMFRNMAWKFPCGSVVKIGFEHGAYNFKRFSKAHYYNLFDVFFMTSRHDVKRIQKLGVTTVKAIGFPKVDDAFNGTISEKTLKMVSEKSGIDPSRKTILFSATWDGSGMSAVHRWFDRLGTGILHRDYNILVTLHPWVSTRYRTVLRQNPDIYFISELDILPYIMLADICIGDTNSLIAEFCMLDKPVITFRVPPTPRTLPDVISLIESISVRIETFEEIPEAIGKLEAQKDLFAQRRKETTRLFFDPLDGNAGKRAAEEITRIVPWLSRKR